MNLPRNYFFQQYGIQPSHYMEISNPMNGEWDMMVLYALLNTYRPKAVLEIGTSIGITAKNCLDRFSFIEKWTSLDSDKAAGKLVKSDSRYNLVVGQTENYMPGEKFDFVFVDSDHSYTGAVRESHIARESLKANGIIVWHDAREFEGVARYINEQNKYYDHITVIQDTNMAFEVVKDNSLLIDRPSEYCIVQGYGLYTFDWDILGALTSEKCRNYAGRHNYGYRLYHDVCPERPASWSKLIFIRRALETYSKVLWVDTDALVTNADKSLEPIFRTVGDIYLAKDINGINCGVFGVNRSDKLLSFLDRVWGHADLIDHVWWEQAALLRELSRSPEINVVYLNKRDINSYLGVLEDWQPGDFICHQPSGGWGKDRYRRFRDLLRKQEGLPEDAHYH